MFHNARRSKRYEGGDLGHHNTVAALKDGEKATIIGIHGGGQLESRLANMGLRSGKSVIRLAALPGHGPVTVEVDGSRVALGHGIARKILVERSGE